MDAKQIAPWALALTFAVLASTQVLHAAGGQKGQGVQVNPLAPPPPAPPKPVRWQYMIQNATRFDPAHNPTATKFYESNQPYNDAGKDGWELVGVLPGRSVSSPAVVNGITGCLDTRYDSTLIYKKPL